MTGIEFKAFIHRFQRLHSSQFSHEVKRFRFMGNQFKLEKISLLYLFVCVCALTVSPSMAIGVRSSFSYLNSNTVAWLFGRLVNRSTKSSSSTENFKLI